MKAKLIYVSLATRVVVEDNATDEQILEAAKANLVLKIRNEIGDHLEEIVDDTECPYDPETDK